MMYYKRQKSANTAQSHCLNGTHLDVQVSFNARVIFLVGANDGGLAASSGRVQLLEERLQIAAAHVLAKESTNSL